MTVREDDWEETADSASSMTRLEFSSLSTTVSPLPTVVGQVPQKVKCTFKIRIQKKRLTETFKILLKSHYISHLVFAWAHDSRSIGKNKQF